MHFKELRGWDAEKNIEMAQQYQYSNFWFLWIEFPLGAPYEVM